MIFASFAGERCITFPCLHQLPLFRVIAITQTKTEVM